MILPSKRIVGLLHNFDTLREYSIRYLLLSQLKVAVDIYTDKLASSAHLIKQKLGVQGQDFNSANIPLNRAVNDTRIFYVSAIAFKLASVFQQPAITIATELANLSSQQILPLHYSEALPTLTIQIVAPGWIHFYLTEQGTAAWLQYLLGTGNREGRQADSEDKKNIFTNHQSAVVRAGLANTSNFHPITLKQNPPVHQSQIFKAQYVHARCCSLLRLGQRQGLIQLSESPVWQILAPQPVPWFSEKGEFYLVNTAEVQLISQILGLIDDISYSNQTNWIKLVDAFETFYSNCRIFGEVKIHQPQLAQARLALVMVARSALQMLLEKRLGILPLPEL